MADAAAEAHVHTRRVFSGVQPSGNLHLGNYLGAVKRFVEMQEEDFETIYCMVDLHAVTVWQDPKELRHAIRELAAAFMACGLDPKKSILFNQSQVPAHAQLAWIFNCVARVGWMDRMTQFKDKGGKDRERVSLGLYCYPSLMAADILVYHATHVPVGEDQKQHLELARDIAQKFNNDFASEDAPVFTLPDPISPPKAARIMNLRDGTKKMSKSDPSEMSRIELADSPDDVMKKIKKAKTDPEPLPSEEKGLEGRPEALNLVTIYAALTDASVEDVLKDFGGEGFGKFKPALGELLVETLRPISERFTALLDDREALDAILARGASQARDIGRPTLEAAYTALGLIR